MFFTFLFISGSAMLDSDQWFAHAFYKDSQQASHAVRKLLDAQFEADHVAVLMARLQPD